MNTAEELPLINYSYVFEFEREFDYLNKRDWMKENWTQCFVYIGAYLIFIFGGQHFMKSRKRFDLRTALFIWNLLLALFSLMGAVRTLPELIYVLREFGFRYSICNPSYVARTRVSGFWTWMFILSKVPELGDTVFIVLRKQPLIFLHWYHHVTVLLYAWYSSADIPALCRWFMVMNYVVHSLMYSYYALRALKIRLPLFVSAFVTTTQLTQMVVGAVVCLCSYRTKMTGGFCWVTEEHLTVSFLMYFSYFLLFLQFFYKAYVKKSFRPQEGAKKD